MGILEVLAVAALLIGASYTTVVVTHPDEPAKVQQTEQSHSQR